MGAKIAPELTGARSIPDEPLTQFSVMALVDELASRAEIKVGTVGPYKQFELKRKYSNDRSSITDATVLIIPNHLVLE